MDAKNLMILAFIAFIIPISCVAYFFTSEESECNSDDFIPNVDTIDNDKEGELNNENKPDIKGDIKFNSNVQIIVDEDSSNPYAEDDLNSLTEAKTNLDPATIDPIIVDRNIPKPEKSLYEGFLEELTKIRETDYKAEGSRTNDSVTDSSEKDSL